MATSPQLPSPQDGQPPRRGNPPRPGARAPETSGAPTVDAPPPPPSAAHAPEPGAPAHLPGHPDAHAHPGAADLQGLAGLQGPQGVPVPVPPGLHPRWWQRRGVRAAGLSGLLALCGLVILALVREQTGTDGFLVGLGLAVLPVPLLVAAFRWLDRVDPAPWRNLVFSFAWGACAAALIAIVANSFATHWIATATADPSGADTLGATVIAPVVEESSKAAAVLLIFLFRRRDFSGLVDGVVVAGVTATGFAFTENVLYLGTAFGDDQLSGDSGPMSLTAATFFVRVIMSPFAHPLFTVVSGIGFGLAAAAARAHRVRRALLPVCGLLGAIGMHAAWNGSSSLGDFGFLLVYVLFMVPVFALVTWLVIWTRQRELHTVRTELPSYALAGWLPPHEAPVLGSLRARRMAREYAAHALGGKAAARAVGEYEAFATSLAFLRRRGRLGRAGCDFVAREAWLLGEVWARRNVARPALAYATRALPRTTWFPPGTAGPWGRPWSGPGGGPGPGAGAWGGHGHGYGYGAGRAAAGAYGVGAYGYGGYGAPPGAYAGSGYPPGAYAAAGYAYPAAGAPGFGGAGASGYGAPRATAPGAAGPEVPAARHAGPAPGAPFRQ